AAASMTIISGYPPGAFRLSLLAIPYALALVVQQVTAVEDRRGYLIELAKACAAAGLVLVVLSAGQVWATAQVLPGTERAALDVGHVLASRTRPGHAAGVFAPASELTPLMMYVGFACVLGVVASLWRSRGEDFVLLLVGALGFFLACGEHAPVLPALAKLPGFSSFRIAGHYLVLPVIVLALVGPIGLARLAERTRLMPGWPAVAVVLAGVTAFFILAPQLDLGRVLIVTMTAGLVLASTFAPTVAWKRRAGWMLVPVLAVDLFIASRPAAEILQPLPDPQPGRTMAEA